MKEKSLDELRISPSGKESKRLRVVFDYFGQKAPGIDTANAAHELDPNDSETVLREIIECSSIEDSSIWFCDRRKKKMTSKELANVNIRESMIYCHKFQKETKLHSLLRHMRNSIAHGNTFALFKATNIWVCLQDFDRDGKPSACITTNRATLRRWMKLLKQASKAQWL